ncbi:hypothetical protein HG530_005191 [Fusarium avenaceum]|nr:hypothetical protein HG530_005191 [Fusarium avenaceum]
MKGNEATAPGSEPTIPPRDFSAYLAIMSTSTLTVSPFFFWATTTLSWVQASAVKSDVTLVHNVPHHVAASRLEAERQGIAILRDREDLSRGVDVALDKVTAHAGISTNGTLKVDIAVLLEGTEVGDA